MRLPPLPQPRLHPSLASLLAGTCALTLGVTTAEANQPFLTDDADVVGKGALEVASLTALAIDDGVHPATEITLAFGIIDPLEVALTLGLEGVDGDPELAPPTLETKVRWLSPEESFLGIGTLAGVGLPVGGGASTVLFGYVPVTWLGPVDVHLNVGVAAAIGGDADGEVLPTFALGAGLPVSDRVTLVAEGLSGAPDGAEGFAWTARGAAGFFIVPEVLQVSVGAAGVRNGDRWTPVLDLGLVWMREPTR